MSDNTKKLIFSVSREDLLFDYATNFSEVFRFSPHPDDPADTSTGVRFQEALGYDFQCECAPFIEIAPPHDAIKNALDAPADNFSIYVTLEDIALGIRKVIFKFDAAEVTELKRHNIDLEAYGDLGFSRGFILRCFVSRNKDVDPQKNVTWSKSHVIFEADFIVKASVDEALFEIAWTTFNDEEERKKVLYFVDWLSDQVSSAPHTECFQVKANNDLKLQFKRLENNRHFGELCIRMIADHIISDLAENTLRCAKLDMEPIEGSLHEKIQALFSEWDLDFEKLAADYQKGDRIDQLRIISDVSRAVQKLHGVAATLGNVKFGGYR